MRVLVFGSRTFEDHEAVGAVLEGLRWSAVSSFDPDGLVVIEGCAPGADHWACHFFDDCGRHLTDGAVHHEHYPADWGAHCRKECNHGPRRSRRDGTTYCPAAGNYRNERQLREGRPDVAWGFVDKPLELSTGSFDMATRLKNAGVETYIVQKV